MRAWKGAVATVALALSLGGLAPQAVFAAPSAALQAKLDGLSPAQKAFIADPANLNLFGLTTEGLYKLLDARDAEGVKQSVADMMATLDAAHYQPAKGPVADRKVPEPLDPDSDMGAVPLNPQAGNYNASTVLRPAILDEYQRDPGPFSLHRYMYEKGGIPTFAGAPVALRKEDLVAGKVDVAFVAAPIDFSSGWRDAVNAPNMLRAMYGIGGFDIYAGIDPTRELTIADYGNLAVDRMSVEESIPHVRAMVAEMVDAGVVPFVVGGDHSVMLSTVAAMTDRFGLDNVSVVHLDAHYNGERDNAHYFSDSQAVSRLIKNREIRGGNVIQVGIRGGEMSADDLAWMRQQGVHMHSMADIAARGWQGVLDATLGEARGAKNVFVSFDMSVLDPAYGTGAGRPAADGLTMREVVPMVRRLCAESHVVGFEMLDVAPYLDLSYATALNANSVMHACLTGIAMRKKGLTQSGYLSPLTVSAK